MDYRGGKHAGLTDEQYNEARIRYYNGESKTSIARNLDTHRTTIDRAIQKDQLNGDVWEVADPKKQGTQPERVERDKAAKLRQVQRRPDNVINITTGDVQKIDTVLQQNMMIALPEGSEYFSPDELREALKEQHEIGRNLTRALKITLADFMAGDLLPSRMQNKADVLNSIAAAAMSVVRVTRQIAGLREGQASEVKIVRETAPQRRFVVQVAESLPQNVSQNIEEKKSS